MNLVQKIRTVWESSRLLNSRIPVQYVVYDNNPYSRVPRAVISIADFGVAARTNQGVAVEQAKIAFTILETSYQTALTIVDNVISSYDGVEFTALQGREKAYLYYKTSEITMTESLWQAKLAFDAIVLRE